MIIMVREPRGKMHWCYRMPCTVNHENQRTAIVECIELHSGWMRDLKQTRRAHATARHGAGPTNKMKPTPSGEGSSPLNHALSPR